MYIICIIGIFLEEGFLIINTTCRTLEVKQELGTETETDAFHPYFCAFQYAHYKGVAAWTL